MIFKHNQTKLVNFSVDKIYNIIADVPSYQEFIKWIKSIEEISKEKNSAKSIKDYKITVGFSFLEESFITRDYFIKNESIRIELLDGVFKTLNSLWTFKELSKDTTEINFSMDFSFKSKILEKMFSNIFLAANEKITDAFIERAKNLYG